MRPFGGELRLEQHPPVDHQLPAAPGQSPMEGPRIALLVGSVPGLIPRPALPRLGINHRPHR